jgi:hypothetical protein
VTWPLIEAAGPNGDAYLAWQSVQKQTDQRSKAEITALNKAIYSELADRTGRCVNDFMSLSEPFPSSIEAAKYRPICGTANLNIK